MYSFFVNGCQVSTSKKQSLNYDVIFLMTNGEMALFSGSRDFVTKLEKLQYQNVFNINID